MNDHEATTGTIVDPLLVSRFDVAMEPAPEEEQVFIVGAVAEDGRPVALLLDREDRAKVGRWLLPHLADEVEQLRAQVTELEAAQAPKLCGGMLPTGQLCADTHRGAERLDAHAAAEAEATHWRRLGMSPPAQYAEDPHESDLHRTHELGLPEVSHTP
ncbi:hypothetical protein [Streptomyces sp. NPDC050848]|uniref:hypothetical protein n=1 Tax=Streptomyces sp. NPDC050848 TaxID=3155791 RepID=UPI0033C504B7